MASILILDDDLTNRKLLRARLAHEGHEIFEAAEGTDALQQIRDHSPDLVISDILMPGMDGYEFVRLLRADPAIAATPVIFHTAHYLEHEARGLAASCNVEHILAKPCDAAELLRTVGLALQSHESKPTIATTGIFEHDHRRLIANKLLQKVQELEREIVERKEAEQRVLHLNRVYAVLSGINSLIVRATSRDELCRDACRLAVAQGHFVVAWIGMVDEAEGIVVPMAWAGGGEDLQANARFDIRTTDESPSRVVTSIRTLRPAICNDLRNELPDLPRREEYLAHGYNAFVALPLVVAERAVGCMVLVTHDTNFFNPPEMHLLEELAADVSFALDHIEKTERLDYLALHDALTGLANTHLLLERLSQQISAARRHDSGVALLIAEVAQLDAINDTLGRQVGDQLLREVAERLVRCTGSSDDVARVGGNRFAVMMADARWAGEVIRTTDQWWSDWVGHAFPIDGHELILAARAGIALFPRDGDSADALLARANVALKQAKASGEERAFYRPASTERSGLRLTLESKLRRALANEEFVLHYQPKVELETRRLRGVEALIRWQSPELGLTLPDKFIPLLEEIGMIAEVGAWVMRQASLDHQAWRSSKLPAPRIAVNVSTAQLRRRDFIANVTDALALSEGTEPGIDVEVTESLIMADVAENISKLLALRDLGIEIAIDDFGTGYSSLAYLARLPAQALKIDRAFVASMLDDAGAMTLVSTIISLGHAMKLTVIAEGVESEEQAKILRLLRCDQMQGFLISRPMPLADMTAYLGRTRP